MVVAPVAERVLGWLVVLGQPNLTSEQIELTLHQEANATHWLDFKPRILLINLLFIYFNNYMIGSALYVKYVG